MHSATTREPAGDRRWRIAYTDEPFLDPSVSSFTGGSLGTKSNFQANTQQSYNSLAKVALSGTAVETEFIGIGWFRLT